MTKRDKKKSNKYTQTWEHAPYTYSIVIKY